MSILHEYNLYARVRIRFRFTTMIGIFEISLCPKEITVHSGIVWMDKNTVVDVKYVRIEIYAIKYQLFT